MGLGLGILIVLVLIVASGIKIIPQSRAFVVERLGAYHRTMQTGLHYIFPFIERVSNNVSLKDQITDPKLYSYGIENPVNAIENLTATTLRNIIGELELDETLTSRDVINTKMRSILDEATDPWGVKVNRVEVKNILPPRDIQESMEKQMRAERERREAILKAEGEKKAAILIAEGEKESTILRADAEKAAKIKAAEGEAEAIIKIQEATAQGLRLLKDANIDEAVLKLKSYEAMVDVAKGNATKIIVPSDLQGLVTAGTILGDSFNNNSDK